MTDLNPYDIYFDLVDAKVSFNGPRHVIQHISQSVSKHIGINEKLLFDRLIEKENKNSSGIGGGVAIPHLQLSSLTKQTIVMITASRPVEFKAVDDAPVDIICALLSPERDGPYHLKRLAEISRWLRNDDVCYSLRHSQTHESILKITQQNKNRMLAA